MSIRSPGYPAIDLQEAIQKADKMYDEEKRSPTSPDVLAEHWGYRTTSSGAKLAVAALKKYGLIEAVGGKKSGQVKLSDLAFKILLDKREESPERTAAIKKAALNPNIHRELWDKW